jgi:alanine racemase
VAVRPKERLERLRPAWARIDLDRLAANYRAVAAAFPVPLMPVVKADAYGHGAVMVTRRLTALGAPLVAAAYAEEAAELRRAGIEVPILVLSGFAAEQWPVMAEHRLTPVVSTAGMLETVLAGAAEPSLRNRGGVSPLPDSMKIPSPRIIEDPLSPRERGRGEGISPGIHLEIDTGMTRLGFSPEQIPAIAEKLTEAGIALDGLMTHLASADEDPRSVERQLDTFDATLADLRCRGHRPRWVHVANSAGLQYLRPTHTLARPGLLLYGLRPRPHSPDVTVSPVMSVSARVAQVRDVPAGTPVSYGGRWTAERPSRIATIPLGYADGVPRSGAAGAFRVRGRPAPVAGRVCMDLTMVDVTDVPGAAEGDEALLFGDEPTAWDVADWAGTNAWQVLTAVGVRVPHVYLEGGEPVAVDCPFAP